jgi:hypothetical protein
MRAWSSGNSGTEAMSKYDDITVIDFIKEMPGRLDGIVTIGVIALFVFGAIMSPIFDVRVGRLSGWNLSTSLIGLAPATFIYYASLVYFSVSGKVSIAINSILVGCIPVLFIYLA